MERKFVVTKANMPDNPSNHWNERTKKLKFLLSLDICVSSLTYGKTLIEVYHSVGIVFYYITSDGKV